MLTQYKVENHLILSASPFQQSKQFGGWERGNFRSENG
jgi:hypothetical protein